MKIFLAGCAAFFVVIILLAAIKTKKATRTNARKYKREQKKAVRSLSNKPLEKLFEESMNASEGMRELLEVDQAPELMPVIKEEVITSEKPQPKVEPPKPVEPVVEKIQYVLLHVMAPENTYYKGYELLQALLANGLRYGKDKIFHRHEQKSGLGKVLFSLTSVNRPGTFDLPNMGNFSCPGLTLFLILNDVEDRRKVFDLMLETAQQIADDIGGEVWDEARKLLTMDTVSKIHNEIELSFEKI